jgi:hypothetical protein
MADGREEREEQQRRRAEEERKDHEDRIEREIVDQWKAERDDS